MESGPKIERRAPPEDVGDLRNTIQSIWVSFGRWRRISQRQLSCCVRPTRLGKRRFADGGAFAVDGREITILELSRRVIALPSFR
jgi:hypothetical protein